MAFVAFSANVANYAYKTIILFQSCGISPARREGGGLLPYKRLMGMCRWMGSHFHDWNDCNGVAFSRELLEWGRKFLDFGGK